jgi:uncharacterized phage protein (TIGR02218 family)
MKTIDATLLAHKAQHATTLCDLLLVGPLSDGSYRGFSGLDQEVTFAPSVAIGTMTFAARTGFEMSALQSSADLSVDNAEGQTLQPVAGYEIEGFTQAEIDSGALDKTRFIVLRVNYKDLTAGRCEVIAGGTIGEVRQKVGGLTVLELRSLTQQLKQMIGSVDSLLCRARFGSQATQNSSGDAYVERFPCGYDLALEWVAGTVETVGAEDDLQFTDSGLTGSSFDADYFAPGLVEFLTGDNAGQQVEVDAYAFTTGAVTLKFPAVSAIQVGDTYRIRRHCTKAWTGHNSCETFWGSDKPLHFRGEPHIPVGDAGQLNSPGAALPRGVSGTGE